jgi:hypothetical protein
MSVFDSKRALGAVVLATALLGCGTSSSTGAGGSGGASANGTGNGTGSATGNATSTGSGAGGPEQACVDAINSYRATLGLPPYQRWTDAESCADGQALSDGTSMSAHGAFGKCMENAQNECPGWPGPPESMIGGCLKMMWAEGPGSDFAKHGHYINMSSTQYTKVACGFHTFADGTVWAVQDFR